MTDPMGATAFARAVWQKYGERLRGERAARSLPPPLVATFLCRDQGTLEAAGQLRLSGIGPPSKRSERLRRYALAAMVRGG